MINDKPLKDGAQFRVTAKIFTRTEMTSGQLADTKDWTYHHILPVRYYYLAAATILRVTTHKSCWLKTRQDGIEALKKMCNNKQNESAIQQFVSTTILQANRDDPTKIRKTSEKAIEQAMQKQDDINPDAIRQITEENSPEAVRRTIQDALQKTIQDYAKRCSSPRFGGFLGPNPGQRSDDPREDEEPNKPCSMDTGQWEALKDIRELLFDAFQLQAGQLTSRQEYTATKTVYEWCELVNQLCTSIIRADGTGGGTSFDPTDWLLSDDVGSRQPWVMRRETPPESNPPKMRLRRQGEIEGYRNFDLLASSDKERLNVVQKLGACVLARGRNNKDRLYVVQ